MLIYDKITSSPDPRHQPLESVIEYGNVNDDIVHANKVPITAYNELYTLLPDHIERALKDSQIITDLYNKPLDLRIYDDDEDEDKEQEPEFFKESSTLSAVSNTLMVSNNSIEVKDIDARSDGSGRSSNIPTPIMTDFEDDDEEFPDSDDHKYDTIIIKSSTHEFDDEPVIDWTSLTINPTDQRLYPGQQEEINDKRFEQTMGEFNDTSREFRKEPTGTLVQLDGIWHQYDIAVGPNIDLLPKLSSRVHPIDDDTKEDMNIANHAPLLLTTPTTLNNRIRSKSRDHRDDDGNQMYTSPLTLKVSSQGVHNKRYSIV